MKIKLTLASIAFGAFSNKIQGIASHSRQTQVCNVLISCGHGDLNKKLEDYINC